MWSETSMKQTPLYFEAKVFDNTLEKEPFNKNREFSEEIYKKILYIQC